MIVAMSFCHLQRRKADAAVVTSLCRCCVTTGILETPTPPKHTNQLRAAHSGPIMCGTACDDDSSTGTMGPVVCPSAYDFHGAVPCLRGTGRNRRLPAQEGMASGQSGNQYWGCNSAMEDRAQRQQPCSPRLRLWQCARESPSCCVSGLRRLHGQR